MITKRLIPLFLLSGKRLVKGTNFKGHIDVGDPTSQGMIYDAQGADEIIIVDIKASEEGRVIDAGVINDMINKCRLPITAGGGIKDIQDARKCFAGGADKIAINTHAILNPDLVGSLAGEFGSQSVVVSIDVKRNGKGGYDAYTHSGRRKADIALAPLLERIIRSGAGEIMVTSIEKEGTLSGFDCGLYSKLRESIPVPFIASGGAGSYDHIVKLFEESDCDACTLGKILFLRDYDMVRIKSYLKDKRVPVREA